jgi:hypothetical protein
MPTGPTNLPTIAPAVSHGITLPHPRSPAAQLAVLKSDIAAYKTLAASGIVSSVVPSASPNGRPMPNCPTETGGGRTGAALGGSSTGTTVSTSIRQRSPKKQSKKRPPPKPNLAAESPLPVISQGKGSILFSLPPDRDLEDTTSSRQKTAIWQLEKTSYIFTQAQLALLAAAAPGAQSKQDSGDQDP